MIKLLWVGDAIAQTGFARVSHSVLDRLALTKEFDISVMGINYDGQPHNHPYKIWPARNGGDVLGYKLLGPLVNQLKPDVVILFNDLWVVKDWLETLKEIKYTGKKIVYFPVDSRGYQEEWASALYNTDKVLVYTEFAKQVLRETGYKAEINIVPHGIDSDYFYPVNRLEARNTLEGLNEDDFIVFNGNRNQPRKRIDITIKAFCQFAKNKPEARLYLHMGLRDAGWDLISLFQREAKKRNIKDAWQRLILTHANLGPANSVPIETLNTIYNTADIGVNTSLGEGWGLISFEQSACGVPQIVPDYSACKELYEGRGLLVKPRQYLSSLMINTEGGLLHEEDVAEAMQYYYDNPEVREQHASDMYKYISSERFSWDTIATLWEKHIKEVFE